MLVCLNQNLEEFCYEEILAETRNDLNISLFFLFVMFLLVFDSFLISSYDFLKIPSLLFVSGLFLDFNISSEEDEMKSSKTNSKKKTLMQIILSTICVIIFAILLLNNLTIFSLNYSLLNLNKIILSSHDKFFVFLYLLIGIAIFYNIIFKIFRKNNLFEEMSDKTFDQYMIVAVIFYLFINIINFISFFEREGEGNKVTIFDFLDSKFEFIDDLFLEFCFNLVMLVLLSINNFYLE